MPDSILDVGPLLDQLELELREIIESRRLSNPAMVGIHTGGAWIAKQLHSRLDIVEPLGTLNINFYRDDFSEIGLHPQVNTSILPFRVEGKDILLIDDVFHTGRTVRAALNEIFDYGRPARVVLGVLLERDGRQIPIRPDCAGGSLTLEAGRRIKLRGPEPLQLTVHSVAS